MARIIEYDEPAYTQGRGGISGGSSAAVVILLVLILYLSGYLPWFTNIFSTPRSGLITAPVDNGVLRSSGMDSRPIIPAGGVNYVTADNLYMRQGPGNASPATYILPRGTRVTLLGESYREVDGDVWVQVRINSLEGVQVGWVNHRYIS